MAVLQSIYSKYDEWYTPEYAVEPIVKYLEVGSTVWCPFDTAESSFVKVLRQKGLRVIHSHIDDGGDFFEVSPPECDYVISNPPYSIKDKVYQRLIDIGLPFAMLINVQGVFDSKYRFELFKGRDIGIIYIYPRIEYICGDSKETSSVPFQSGYLCYKILTDRIAFEVIERE